MKGLFASTASVVESGHGGGSVSWHEREALGSITTPCPEGCPQDITVQTLDSSTVSNPYPDNPFMFDYMASLAVEHTDIAFFNGAPWNATRKASGASRVIVDCPAHDLNESITEWKRVTGNYPFDHMTDRDKFLLYTRFIQEADVVIVPSRYSEAALRTNHPISGKVEVISHGCELPEEVKPIPDMFTVGYLGANGPDKGVTYLARAWAGLMYKDAELVLRTEGEFPVLARTKYRVSGKIENTSDFYNSISVYVQPSVTEGFGLPVLEAMAHGRPVIVTEGCGASELVREGINGFVVPIRDPGGIADWIEFLKDRPDLIVSVGKAARATAERYTWTAVRERIKEVIRGLS